MVFTTVLVIRGIVLNRAEVLRVKNMDEEMDEDSFYNDFYEIYIGCIEPFISDLGLYTWPCCSDLHNKRFILGTVVTEYDIDDIFNTVVTQKSMEEEEKFDLELAQILIKHKLGDKTISDILLLDDCTSCS